MRAILVFLTLLWAPITLAAPPTALPYQRSLTREARAVWGMQAPIAVMAAQIEQESAWNPGARSPFATGLAQFTPRTAAWISGAYPRELGTNSPFDPRWAIRALVQYDFNLFGQMSAEDDCNRWAFTLSAYNGGASWISRDRQLCVSSDLICNPQRWFGHVERFTARGPSAARENRGYPRRILLRLQSGYSAWGGNVQCSA